MNALAQVIPFPVKHDPELTKREAAARLRCSTRSIERYIDPDYCAKRGIEPLPSFTTPFGQRRFRLSEVERWNEGKVA